MCCSWSNLRNRSVDRGVSIDSCKDAHLKLECQFKRFCIILISVIEKVHDSIFDIAKNNNYEGMT